LPVKLIKTKKDQALAYSPAWVSVTDMIDDAILAFGGRDWRRSKHTHSWRGQVMGYGSATSEVSVVNAFLGDSFLTLSFDSMLYWWKVSNDGQLVLSFRLIGLQMEGSDKNS
ncbi:hypothetical protein HAX54_041659, partial [Datura stramonium]|nr:hypothetical protein [Datura stramonium]